MVLLVLAVHHHLLLLLASLLLLLIGHGRVVAAHLELIAATRSRHIWHELV